MYNYAACSCFSLGTDIHGQSSSEVINLLLGFKTINKEGTLINLTKDACLLQNVFYILHTGFYFLRLALKGSGRVFGSLWVSHDHLRWEGHSASIATAEFGLSLDCCISAVENSPRAHFTQW